MTNQQARYIVTFWPFNEVSLEKKSKVPAYHRPLRLLQNNFFAPALQCFFCGMEDSFLSF